MGSHDESLPADTGCRPSRSPARRPSRPGRLNASSRVMLRLTAAPAGRRQAAAAGRSDGHDRRQHPGHDAAVHAGRAAIGGRQRPGRQRRRRRRPDPAADAGRQHRRRTSRSASGTNLSIPGPAGPIPARHYRPIDSAMGEPLLVFFHGGGFVVGDLETHDDLCRLLCRDARRARVVGRLPARPRAPGARRRRGLLRRVPVGARARGRARRRPGRVAVGGDSAGGNLAAVVSQLARNDGIALPALQLLLYPVTNFASDTRSKTLFADGFFLTKKDMDWFRDNYLAGARRRRRRPARLAAAGRRPVRTAAGDGADGRLRPAARRGQPVRRGACARRASPSTTGEFGSLVHGFANFFPLGGGSATATAEIVSALRAHLRRTLKSRR